VRTLCVLLALLAILVGHASLVLAQESPPEESPSKTEPDLEPIHPETEYPDMSPEPPQESTGEPPFFSFEPLEPANTGQTQLVLFLMLVSMVLGIGVGGSLFVMRKKSEIPSSEDLTKS